MSPAAEGLLLILSLSCLVAVVALPLLSLFSKVPSEEFDETLEVSDTHFTRSFYLNYDQLSLT